MLIMEFLQNLKSGKDVPAHVIEEYQDYKGGFDLSYLQYKCLGKMGKGAFRDLVNSTFGKVTFEKSEVPNEVSKELFEKHYRFGKYKNAREWIGYFHYSTGLLLTKAKLYGYLS